MPANYVILGKVTLGASAASVTFSNIPQTGYTDLKVVGSLRTDRATGSVATVSLRLNSITTSVYSSKELAGTGSATDNGTFTNVAPTSLQVGRISQSTDTANTFGSLEVYIPNYAGSTAKSASCESVQENNATAAYTQMTAWLCTDTAAINALTFTTNSGTNFVANSTFYLYGIAAVGTTPVIAPFASGGDIVTNDGTYWIHTFLSSGTFTPAKALTCDALVIAGGGGGGQDIGGGGGAGGFRTSTALSTTAQSYSITVGAGGASDTAGNNSIFSSITSTGGGKGGSNGAGGAGGSGGGGGGGTNPASVGGAASPSGQGFAGASGTYAPSTSHQGGGGGGANAAATGINGGNGLASSYSGTSVTYAGGGGAGAYNIAAGTGGTGGGGNGKRYDGTAKTGDAGTTNLGGGGGGGSAGGSAASGGAGGSGIVIVRYPIAS